jgi:lipoprotein-releasing system permease protein
LNYEFFIAKRIVSGAGSGTKVTRPIVHIAILGVALGIAVMIVSVAIVTGFQHEIREKVIGFGGHIQISNYDANNSLEIKPVDRRQAFLPSLKKTEGIQHIQVYATKAGIVKTDSAIEGVVLKGLGSDFDWTFFKNKLIQGKTFEVKDSLKSNEVLISKYLADKLNLKVNEKLHMYFVQQPPRARAFNIAGIYETGLEEFDKLFVLCDIAHIQKLNDWTPRQVGGFEVALENFNSLTASNTMVYHAIGYNLNARTVKDLYPQIFDWLELQNINVIIIIVLMVVVAGINMISALLIIILERTNMIGILKAIGAGNWSIRKVFLYTAGYLTGLGLFWGNILGLTLCFVQKHFGLIKLSQENYYVALVPINFPLSYFLILNAGTLLVCILMLVVPTFIITRISPVKAIRFA